VGAANVLAWFELLKLVLSLVPMLVQAIKAVEDAIPGNGYGEQKLALVRSIIESAYEKATGALGSFEQMWPILESTIGAIVRAFNSTGVFKKS
jgi:hypothetical protein